MVRCAGGEVVSGIWYEDGLERGIGAFSDASGGARG